MRSPSFVNSVFLDFNLTRSAKRKSNRIVILENIHEDQGLIITYDVVVFSHFTTSFNFFVSLRVLWFDVNPLVMAKGMIYVGWVSNL